MCVLPFALCICFHAHLSFAFSSTLFGPICIQIPCFCRVKFYSRLMGESSTDSAGLKKVIQFGLTMVRATQRWSIREREPIGVRVGVHSGRGVFGRKLDFAWCCSLKSGKIPHNFPKPAKFERNSETETVGEGTGV